MKRPLLIGALALLAALGTACSGDPALEEPGTPESSAMQPTSTPTPEPSPTATPEPSPTPTPPASSARELLEAGAALVLGVGSFHFDTDIELSVQSEGLSLDVPISVSGDFQAPDAFRASMALSLVLLVIDLEMVSKDGTTYLKDPATDEWTVIAGGIPLFSDPTELVRLEAGRLSDLALAGVELLEGVEAYRVTAIAPAGTYSSSTGDFQVSFWIGVDDGLLTRVSARGDIVLAEEKFTPLGRLGSGAATVSIVLTLSDFGQDVSIEAPETARQ